MTGGYSGRFSLKFLCALICAFFAFSIAINCFESHDVRADAVVECGVHSSDRTEPAAGTVNGEVRKYGA